MTARSACASTTVDTAAIAAAVVAELDVPTAAENATAVGAQAACSAAIAAAGLATASAVSTLQTAVNLLPVDGDVTTLVGAALTAAAGAAIPSVVQNQAGLATSAALGTLQTTCDAIPTTAELVSEVGDLLSPPGSGPFLSGALSGSTSYTIAAAVPGSYYVLYGFEITGVGASSFSVQWKNTGGTAIGGVHTVPSTGQRVVAPGSRESYKTAVGEGLALAEPSAGVTMHVTYWGEYKT